MTATITSNELKQLIDSGNAPILIDVRNENELQYGRITKKSILIPLPEIKKRFKEIEKFKDSIPELTRSVYDKTLAINGVEKELALVISQSASQFQKILYKSACLEEDDFTKPGLYIYTDGKVGPSGNIMNSPWDQLLSSNLLFSRVDYVLKNDEWNVLSTQGISLWRRYKVAGYETVIYRLALKIIKILPDWFFKKELLMPNENELNIEIASSLILHGVKITEINLDTLSRVNNIILDKDVKDICKPVLQIMRKRVEHWTTQSAIEVTLILFQSYLEGQLKYFKLLTDKYEKDITKSHIEKKAVLVNTPGNIEGQALAYVCRKNGVPLMSSQHGVTIEISESHKNLHIEFDSSAASVMFSYNTTIIDIQKDTYFNQSKHYLVGMHWRLVRMKSNKLIKKTELPIVYISTNLNSMGFSTSSKTDYGRAINENNLVLKVLSKLPHKVCYKTYPEDNRRYADSDPVLNSVKLSHNMKIFSKKIDMRYIINRYNILVTSCATSTLGWLAMSEKPIVFINDKNNNPLTNSAYDSISKGMFVFSANDENFHLNLRVFLSKPVEVIEELWKEKKLIRNEMIREFFTAYSGGAGKKASKIILKEYL